MYMFSASLAWLGTAVACLTASFTRDSFETLFSALGVAALFLMRRLVAGPNYALLAAFYRGKRAYADHVREEISKARAHQGGRTRKSRRT